jgi:hypothetical protein
MDSRVQSFSFRGESNLQRAPTLQWCAAASMQLGERHFGKKANFDGANQLLLIRGGNFLRSFAIEARQNPVQVAGTMFVRVVPQSLSKLFRALRNVGQPFEQRTQVETRADCENWEARAATQVGESRERHLPVAARRGRFLRAEHIHQVMRNSVAFGNRGFGRADVEPAIELRRIACDYFPAELFSQPNAQR